MSGVPRRAWAYLAMVAAFTAAVVVVSWPEPKPEAGGDRITIARTVDLLEQSGIELTPKDDDRPTGSVTYALIGGIDVHLQVFETPEGAERLVTPEAGAAAAAGGAGGAPQCTVGLCGDDDAECGVLLRAGSSMVPLDAPGVSGTLESRLERALAQARGIVDDACSGNQTSVDALVEATWKELDEHDIVVRFGHHQMLPPVAVVRTKVAPGWFDTTSIAEPAAATAAAPATTAAPPAIEAARVNPPRRSVELAVVARAFATPQLAAAAADQLSLPGVRAGLGAPLERVLRACNVVVQTAAGFSQAGPIDERDMRRARTELRAVRAAVDELRSECAHS